MIFSLLYNSDESNLKGQNSVFSLYISLLSEMQAILIFLILSVEDHPSFSYLIKKYQSI